MRKKPGWVFLCRLHIRAVEDFRSIIDFHSEAKVLLVPPIVRDCTHVHS